MPRPDGSLRRGEDQQLKYAAPAEEADMVEEVHNVDALDPNATVTHRFPRGAKRSEAVFERDGIVHTHVLGDDLVPAAPTVDPEG